MTVKQLIERLQECNPNAWVAYDPLAACENREMSMYNYCGQKTMPHLSVDDVVVGQNHFRGFVFLKEESSGEY